MSGVDLRGQIELGKRARSFVHLQQHARQLEMNERSLLRFSIAVAPELAGEHHAGILETRGGRKSAGEDDGNRMIVGGKLLGLLEERNRRCRIVSPCEVQLGRLSQQSKL